MQRNSPPRASGWMGRVLALLVLAACLKVLVGVPAADAPARAQIPDSAAQRLELIQEVRRTNELLADIQKTLNEHTFNVRMAGADKQSPAPAKSGGGGL